MSKAYGLPGLRVGWLACRDRSFLLRAERLKHYLSICNAGPSELLALIALKAGDAILTRNRAIIAQNLERLDEFFADFPDRFEWRQPEGGCVGCVGYRGRDGVEAFTSRLVNEAGVMLLPASVYHSELNEIPGDFFRVGFGRTSLPDGVAAWRDWMKCNVP
jgi:aspartate/methionine/tyrosine aminotransferase